MIQPTAKMIFTNPWHFLSFGFGSGLSPFAPGTMGTVVAIPLYLLIHNLSLSWYALIVVVTFAMGVWLCGYSAKIIGVHDYKGIVWDEIVGYFVTMMLVPCTWWTVILGFILFRFFDIWKPWPIRWFDRQIQGGFGIMFDDFIAAIYATIVLIVVVQLVN